jgi:plasmid rolling circle replication initiator protein Rep
MTQHNSADGSEIYLANVSNKDHVWDDHKSSATAVSKNYQKVDYDAYSKRIWDCARSLTFALKPDDNGISKLKLHAARFCRVRWCPICQWRRSLMWRGRFLKHIPRILADHPTARFVFLTLTVRNCHVSELKETLVKMNKAWELLTKRKEFPALGFVKSVEVTKAKDGTAHPHFHCLLMVTPNYFSRNYINQDRWTELWQKSLRIDYKPMVNVKAIKKPKLADSTNLDQQMIKAICETLKYSVKESDLESEAEWLKELTNQMHKTRAISLGGVFREYLAEDDPEDLIHCEEQEDIDVSKVEAKLIFDWADIVRRYTQRI